MDSIPSTYRTRWSNCIGVFNDNETANSRMNEEIHFRKHAIIANEWERTIDLQTYRLMATEHLNSLDADNFVELCQADDLAVVKYNLLTGELGIARRDNGSIKTFFRPNDVGYVLRKVEAGLWGEPDIVDGLEERSNQSDFDDDPDKLVLFTNLESLAVYLPSLAHSVVLEFAEDTPPILNSMQLIAKLGEYHFTIFELNKHILTASQCEEVSKLQKKVVIAEASFEALIKHRSKELTKTLIDGFDKALKAQEELWQDAISLIGDTDQFENTIMERQLLGYSILELKLHQIHNHLTGIDVIQIEHRLLKSDLYFRKVFYQLARQFEIQSLPTIAPESFFWCSMAQRVM